MSKSLRKVMSKPQHSTQRTGLAACTSAHPALPLALHGPTYLPLSQTCSRLCPLCLCPQLFCSSGNTSEAPSQKFCSSVPPTVSGDLFFLPLPNPNLPLFHLGPLFLVVYILNTEIKLFSSIQKHFMHKKTYFVLSSF